MLKIRGTATSTTKENNDKMIVIAVHMNLQQILILYENY